MPNSTPFAYNTGSSIPGTDKIGNLSLNTPTDGFGATGLKWWNGPDEDLGYVVALPDPEGNSTGADSERAYLNFIRSSAKTEAAFIEMVNAKFNQAFTTGNAAKTWLNTNGYWTSWINSGPTLLAALDANVAESYPNAGTGIWADLINNNNATIEQGSGTVSWNTYGGGASFEFGAFDLNGGSNARFNFGNTEVTKLSTSTTKTYSIWFQADAVGFMSFSKTLMCKLQGLGGSSTTDGFWMGINSSNQLVAKVVSNNGSVSKYIAGIGATVSTGVWYMATLVVKVSTEENSFRLYLNSTEIGSTTGGGTSLSSDTRSLLLGNYDSGVQGAQGFDGRIAEFRIFEGDFSAETVSQLFTETRSKFGV